MKTPQERYLSKPFQGSSHSWAFAHLESVTPQTRVLDIGSGSGVLGTFLKERSVTKLYAVEIDAEARKHVAGIYQEVQPDLASFSNQQFDLILLLDVLEHMSNPFDYLEGLTEYLSPGGRVFISVPNVAHWSVRFPLLFGFFEYTDRGILDRTHLQFFNRKRFLRLLESFPAARVAETSASIEPLEFVLPKLIWDNPLFAVLSGLRLSLARVLPGMFAYQHLGIIQKN